MKIKTLLLSLIAVFSIGALVLAPAATHAQTTKSSICEGVGLASGGGNCDQPATNLDGSTNPTVESTITKIINIFGFVVGVVAVIMIILGGFKYITSAGDSSKVSSAKDTILYAIIGLVVVALSQVIVRFVLTKIA